MYKAKIKNDKIFKFGDGEQAMCLGVEYDFYCSLRGVKVVHSEYNSDKSYYHEPEKGTPYVAAGWGRCPCATCDKTEPEKCKFCKWPKELSQENNFELKHGTNIDGSLTRSPGLSRCTLCQSVYKVGGRLR